MKDKNLYIKLIHLLIPLSLMFCITAIAWGQGKTNDKPNILIFVADDLGWADPGFRGSPIETPVIDRLAREGVQLNRFYVAPICSPTRAALMTGRVGEQMGAT